MSTNDTFALAFDSLFFTGFLSFACDLGVERVDAYRLDPVSFGKLFGFDFDAADLDGLGLGSTCLLLPLVGSTTLTGFTTGLSLLNLENLA